LIRASTDALIDTKVWSRLRRQIPVWLDWHFHLGISMRVPKFISNMAVDPVALAWLALFLIANAEATGKTPISISLMR
jgi:hypothetical protein